MRDLVLLAGVAGCTAEVVETVETPIETATNACIQAEGVGYDTLQSAIDGMADGATLQLCASQDFEETVTIIGREVTISGPGAAIWKGLVDGPALEISGGAKVTLSSLNIDGTKSGIRSDNSELTLENVRITDISQWGIQSYGGELVVMNSYLEDTRGGGILVSGGTADIQGTTVDGARSAGIRLEADAVANIARNTVVNTEFKGKDDADEIDNGYGIDILEGSNAVLANNTWADNLLAGIHAQGASQVSIENDTIIGGITGVWVDTTSFNASMLSVSDVYRYGVIAMAVEDFALTDFTIEADPNSSALHQYDSAGNTLADGSTGIISVDTNLELTRGVVSGHNTAGILQQVTGANQVIGSFEDLSIQNNARIGLGVWNSTASLTNVEISGTRIDEGCGIDGAYSCNGGMWAVLSTVDWRGGGTSNNGMWGMVSLSGAATITDILVANNGLYGLQSEASNITVTDVSFQGPAATSLVTNESYTTVVNSRFSGNIYDSSYDDVDDQGNPTTDVSHNVGRDIAARYGTLSIDGTTFDDGNQAIYGYDVDADIRDIQIRDYTSHGVYLSSTTATPAATLSGANVERIGGRAIYCSSGTLNADHISVKDQLQNEIWYESYTNGVLDSETRVSYSYPTVDAFNCDMTLDDVTVHNVPLEAIDTYNGSLEITNLTVSKAGTEAYDYNGSVTAAFYSDTPNVTIADATFGRITHGHAVKVTGSSAYPGGNVTLHNVRTGDMTTHAKATTGSDAISLSQLDLVTITDLSVENAQGTGIVATNVHATIDGKILSPGEDGMRFSGESSLTVDGLDIFAPGNYGLQATTTKLDTRGFTIRDAGSSGIYLSGGTNHVITTTTTVENAANWGMICVGTPTFAVCDPSLDGATGPSFNCGC
jgi:hypothetical protein